MKSKGVEITPFFCNGIHSRINPLAARLSNRNFHPLEIVSRYASHNFKWVKITRARSILSNTLQLLVIEHALQTRDSLFDTLIQMFFSVHCLHWRPKGRWRHDHSLECPESVTAPRTRPRGLLLAAVGACFCCGFCRFLFLPIPRTDRDRPESRHPQVYQELTAVLLDVNRISDVIMPYTAPDFLSRG